LHKRATSHESLNRGEQRVNAEWAPSTRDEARLAAHLVALRGERSPADEIGRHERLMTVGVDGTAPLTNALRELFGRCPSVDEAWRTAPLDATGERSVAIEIVARLHAAGSSCVHAAFASVVASTPSLSGFLEAIEQRYDQRFDQHGCRIDRIDVARPSLTGILPGRPRARETRSSRRHRTRRRWRAL
jgi:hypothetical protein